MADDTPKPIRTVERVREWGHAPTEGYCYRKDKLVHTPVQKVPHECHGCPSQDWESKGIVHRLKGSKEIVHREP